jgi:hypothetical protein
MRRRIPLLVLAVLACRGGETSAAAADESPAAAVSVAAASGAGAAATLTAADLDDYERALAGDVAASEAAVARLRAARTAADSAAARAALQPAATGDSAARRAGIPRARYQDLEYRVGSVVNRSVLNRALARVTAITDTAQIALLPPEGQARVRARAAQAAALASDSAIYAGVPAALLPELKARVAGPLGALWRRRLALQGEAAVGR